MSIDDLIARLKASVTELENAFEDADEERQSDAITAISDIVDALVREIIAERRRGVPDD